MAEADPVLLRIRDRLAASYGDRIERVVLYGSRARGEAGPDSDYDVAVFFRDLPDRAAEMWRLADIGTEILYEVGRVVHAVPFQAGDYAERTPLMGEIRQDGIEI